MANLWNASSYTYYLECVLSFLTRYIQRRIISVFSPTFSPTHLRQWCKLFKIKNGGHNAFYLLRHLEFAILNWKRFQCLEKSPCSPVFVVSKSKYKFKYKIKEIRLTTNFISIMILLKMRYDDLHHTFKQFLFCFVLFKLRFKVSLTLEPFMRKRSRMLFSSVTLFYFLKLRFEVTIQTVEPFLRLPSKIKG